MKRSWKWIDARSAICLVAAIALFFAACFFVDELDKRNAEAVATEGMSCYVE